MLTVVMTLILAVRGIAGRTRTVGNFWVDITRTLVRVLVPLSVIGALVLVSQGAVQNFSGFRTAVTLAGQTRASPNGSQQAVADHTEISRTAVAVAGCRGLH